MTPRFHPSDEDLPPEEEQKQLEDTAFDLVSRASFLAAQTNSIVMAAIGMLVRSMNCYYSDLIEGHDTHPRDIDKALRKDYSAEPAHVPPKSFSYVFIEEWPA